MRLTREQNQLIDEHAHRKVRTIMRTDHQELHHLICDIAAGEQFEWDRIRHKGLLATLDQEATKLGVWTEQTNQRKTE